MRHFLIVGGALAALTASSFAADLAAQPDAPAYDWSGFYVGVHGGYAWTDVGVELTPLPTPLAGLDPFNADFESDGFLGGVQAGYNWQSGSLVFGIEGDISYVDLEDEVTVLDFGADPEDPSTSSQTIDWLATIRGRVGFTASDSLLLYVTGGLAVADVEIASLTTFDPDVPDITYSGQEDDTLFGFAVGAGLEWGFAENWSFKAEYVYFNLEDSSLEASPLAPNDPFSIASEFETDGHIARAGINYRF